MLPEYNNKLIPTVMELKKEMTPQERLLWYLYLRSHPLRFQRQKTIGDYIVDFYCHSAKMVVEIDGSQHYSDEGKADDSKRDDFLKKYGLQTIRIADSDVNQHFYAVCQYINGAVKERMNVLASV